MPLCRMAWRIQESTLKLDAAVLAMVLSRDLCARLIAIEVVCGWEPCVTILTTIVRTFWGNSSD